MTPFYVHQRIAGQRRRERRFVLPVPRSIPCLLIQLVFAYIFDLMLFTAAFNGRLM